MHFADAHKIKEFLEIIQNQFKSDRDVAENIAANIKVDKEALIRLALNAYENLYEQITDIAQIYTLIFSKIPKLLKKPVDVRAYKVLLQQQITNFFVALLQNIYHMDDVKTADDSKQRFTEYLSSYNQFQSSDRQIVPIFTVLMRMALLIVNVGTMLKSKRVMQIKSFKMSLKQLLSAIHGHQRLNFIYYNGNSIEAIHFARVLSFGQPENSSRLTACSTPTSKPNTKPNSHSTGPSPTSVMELQ